MAAAVVVVAARVVVGDRFAIVPRAWCLVLRQRPSGAQWQLVLGTGERGEFIWARLVLLCLAHVVVACSTSQLCLQAH